MQITRAGEYGVLGLMNLARLAPGRMVMLEEISRVEKIPHSFLAKIFQNLAKGGLVRSNRGAGGGFALTRNPSQITVLEIIEAIEGKIIFQRCKQAKPDCEHKGNCALCGLFEQAQDGVTDVLARTTLRALVKQQKMIAAPLPPCDSLIPSPREAGRGPGRGVRRIQRARRQNTSRRRPPSTKARRS